MKKRIMPLLLLVLLLSSSLGNAFAKRDRFKISPRAIGLFSFADSVTVHTEEGYAGQKETDVDLYCRNVEDVGCATDQSITASATFADDRGNLVARFEMSDVWTLIDFGDFRDNTDAARTLDLELSHLGKSLGWDTVAIIIECSKKGIHSSMGRGVRGLSPVRSQVCGAP